MGLHNQQNSRRRSRPVTTRHLDPFEEPKSDWQVAEELHKQLNPDTTNDAVFAQQLNILENGELAGDKALARDAQLAERLHREELEANRKYKLDQEEATNLELAKKMRDQWNKPAYRPYVPPAVQNRRDMWQDQGPYNQHGQYGQQGVYGRGG